MTIIDLRVAAPSRQTLRIASNSCEHEILKRLFGRAPDTFFHRELVMPGGSRSRHHGKVPDEIDWSVPERQTRAVAELLGALDDVPRFK